MANLCQVVVEVALSCAEVSTKKCGVRCKHGRNVQFLCAKRHKTKTCQPLVKVGKHFLLNTNRFSKLQTEFTWLNVTRQDTDSRNLSTFSLTSDKNQHTRYPNTMASLASRSCMGIPMCVESHNSCFHSSNFHAALAMSKRTTRGDPSISHVP